ncbi:serine-protein kinase ATM [Danaus plexippus plexippus]|uniref:Serine/threonine-protein kinase ATM n=1 Tax=Danaus plexippus plexippus TaxID=278856 RepID=A0A212ESY2_DANPL|nr:serine-protein kinase ATM [Danaus plexippus plexippus]
MPVNDHTVATLNGLCHKFYIKTCYSEMRQKYFAWLVNGNITNLNVDCIEDFILRLISNDNISIHTKSSADNENVYDVIFKHTDRSLLYNEFEYRVTDKENESVQDKEHFEVNSELYAVIEDYLEKTIIINDDVDLIKNCKYLEIVIAYINLILKFKLKTPNEVESTLIYVKLQKALEYLYTSLTKVLKSGIQIRDKIATLKAVQGILMKHYEPLLNKVIRSYIEEDCFNCIHDVIRQDVPNDEGDNYYDEEIEFTPVGLKLNCIHLLAAYCRHRSEFTGDIMKCISDPDLYNFSNSWEIEGALKFMQIINEVSMERSSIELLFGLIKNMCRELFRRPKATRGLLLIVKEMLDKIWSSDHDDEILQQNCFIMIDSFSQRCKNLYYPPDVAALLYECIAKIVELNNKRNLDRRFKDVLIDAINRDNHKIRLYCCHLLRLMIEGFSEDDFQELIAKLKNIFVINVSDNKETVLRDELMNRTTAVLHCFYVMGLSKRFCIHEIVIKVIEFQSEKCMDQAIVKKVLNILTTTVTNSSIEVYMNDNILRILEYWFQNNKQFEDLPLFLFGSENIDELIQTHLKWLVATDILWRSKGVVENSAVLKYITGHSLESAIEMCFCNIVALSIPYIVIEKYKIETGRSNESRTAEASKMFQSTRKILKNDKWSNLFVENLRDLLLLTAESVSDHDDASRLFGFQLMNRTDSYTYSKHVFSGILEYFGELIDGCIMQYLCENQPLVLLNVLFKLWNRVLREKIFAYRLLAFHAYLVFIDKIPFGYPSDAILYTFACVSICNALKESNTNDDVKIFVDGLQKISKRVTDNWTMCNEKSKKLMMSKIITILDLKISEGFDECDGLLCYITEDIKKEFAENEDVVDYMKVMSQGTSKMHPMMSKVLFCDKLKTFTSNLSNASHRTLEKLHLLIKSNKKFMNDIYMEASDKGFSEDCKNSVVHQIISTLSYIIKTTSYEKVIIKSCECLAEIGCYDIKTLVTVPPTDKSRIVDVSPKQYFAESALSSLAEHLFDDDPTLSNAIAIAISDLLMHRDGKIALDAVENGKDMLLSLSTSNCKTNAVYKVENIKFDLYNAIDYWIPNRDESLDQWVTRLTLALLDLVSSSTNYLRSLITVCAKKPSISKRIMPALMGLILSCSTDVHAAVFGGQINEVFRFIWSNSFDDDFESSEFGGSPKNARNISHDHKMIVHYLLDIVDFVRIQMGHCKFCIQGRKVKTLNYLNLEYDKVSWGATVSEQPLLAIFYGELWAAAANGAVPPAAPCDVTQLPGGDHVQRIFRRCYVSIGEMDAIDGCGTAHLTIEKEKRKHLINTGQYSDALLFLDIALSRGNEDDNVLYGVVTSLHKLGMHHLALQYIKSYPESDKLDDIKYDCLSYLGDWSHFVDTVELENKLTIDNIKQDSIIKAMRYSCLKDCLNMKPSVDFDMKLEKPFNRAKLAIAKLCQNLNMENCQSVYKVVSYLHLFSDIEQYFSVRCGKMSILELIRRWKVDDLPLFSDFKHVEGLICQRSLILDHAAQNYSISTITDLQLQYAELGLSNKRIQMAQRLVASVKNHLSSKKVALLESQISWAKGHKDIALSLLNGIIIQEKEDPGLMAMSLRQYGLWMAESKRENARDIIHKYLEKSLIALNSREDVTTRFKVYYDIATFADAEYKQVVSYMNSSVYEDKVKCVENMKGAEASLNTSQQRLTKDQTRALKTNQTFRRLDEADIVNTKGEKESFLKMALKYYLLSLKISDENNLSVFRVISLWFDNPGFEFEDENLDKLLHEVPLWKFITVLPQLAPRLSNEDTPFAKQLNKLIKRCALEHPHHTLPILFNLKNSDKDSIILNASSSVSLPSSVEPRILAAGRIIQELSDTEIALPISQMEQICNAIISFAYYVPKSKDLKAQTIPRTEPISALNTLNAVPIPTDTIPIKKDSNYSQIATLSSFESSFELVGGINYPKKISCLGSDGKKRIMLIKGEDDLRQDAVMQQVFTIVNTLLEKNPITNRSKLLIRTYKVSPMSRRSGALEWCVGTSTLGTYLLDAHKRYRPQDIPPSTARGKIKTYQENRASNKRKLELFKDILKAFRPVFHYFFTENYLDPVTWYERRDAYTRSVATSSMVGYIMGLGDRHVQNILIDGTTAELIHIDFGIAFDQGKALNTPETVPFRLTQDIIAGFGCSGVEGIFRRCCEKTLQLLRDHQETLLTILEVLLCDPLYFWIVSKNTKLEESNSESSSSSGLASRALLAVRSKLSGAEGVGGSGGVSVTGHVARLISDASDPANLCRMFHGWQAYL